MKLVMIYDQIQAGAGTKDDKMVGLNITKEKVGPAVMMSKYLNEVDGNVIATLYCGNGYYMQNQEETVRKLSAMVKKLNPDVVICGPSFNYAEFSQMCGSVAQEINSNGIPAICAMSEENQAVITKFKDEVPIVKCPKKGGTGLNHTLKTITTVATALYNGIEFDKSDLY